MPSDRLAQISFQAALRTLDLQERAVEQLRLRTGVLLGASSLIASFFGSNAVKRGDGFGPLAAIGLIMLAVSIGLCVYVLLPKRGLNFSLDGHDVYERLRGVESEAVLNAHLTIWLTAFARENEVQLSTLDSAYVGAAVCLMLQLAAWSVPLVATLR